jgi:hypothetical protein
VLAWCSTCSALVAHAEPGTAGVSGICWPTAVGATRMPHDVDGIGEPLVVVGARVNEVLESAKHVEVPLGELREAGATTDGHLAAAMGLVQPVSEEELLPTLGVVPMSNGKPHQDRDDAGLGDLPSALPLPEALASSQRCAISRKQAQPNQVLCERR